jgi:hypothetical protein
MIVDETIVQQVLRVRKAYPSKSEAEIAEEVNRFFSKKETMERVTAIAKTVDGKDMSGRFIQKFWPMLLLHTYEYQEGLKFVMDSRNTRLQKRFIEFCKEFGIQSHLKKHGSSKYQVFRMLPDMPALKLKEVVSGEPPPTEYLWELLYLHVVDYYSTDYWDRTELDIPIYRTGAKSLAIQAIKDHMEGYGAFTSVQVETSKVILMKNK